MPLILKKKETFEEKSARATKIAQMLLKMYERRKTMLTYSNPWECLVAVQLSAQCTDKRVNIVTPALFKHYPSVKHYAEAPAHELEELIHSTGFYRNKAKNIQAAARIVVEEFGGEVPRTMEEMLKLPGVARKSANVILFNAFGIVEGVAVDTHVMRITKLLGLISKDAEGNPVKIEREMMKLLPKKHYGTFSLLITEHGRASCIARRPQCGECKFNQICPGSEV
ncbi:endonuclease III [Candidatus Peregrinibacteria bacterium]|jgi:endonuclease III|nr:endonuclease III [Candidatus Peregrinibacteria bacterium]MBT4055743.1 endonuclease III [Candidatus Peregrinibacteria bacterium]